MKLEIKRDALLVIPENDQDRAFLEDTLQCAKPGDLLQLERVSNVTLGFAKDDEFVLKSKTL